MNIENYSYLWNEKKEDYVLVNSAFGYSIVNKKTRSVLLVCNDELECELIAKMIENGCSIYDDVNQAYGDN